MSANRYAVCGLALALGGPVVLALATRGAPALAAALLFVAFGPGLALVAHARATPAVLGALVVPLSLAVFAVGDTLMIWTDTFHPLVLFDAVAGVSGASCAIRLVLGRTRLLVLGLPQAVPQTEGDEGR